MLAMFRFAWNSAARGAPAARMRAALYRAPVISHRNAQGCATGQMRGRGHGGGDSKEEEKGAGNEFELLDKVQEFCTSQFLEEQFEEFARKHYQPFVSTADDGRWSSSGDVEHKLEYTEIYESFLAHFDRQISDFIEEEGGSAEQFHRECQRALRSMDDCSPRRFFIEILLATTEYDRFYFLMVAEAKKLGRESFGKEADQPVSRK